MGYKPHRKQEMILDRAWEHVQSVPYSVSLRWLFYRLYQEGFYTDKKGYNRFKDLMSEARKRFYKDWTPSSLVDETRQLDTWGQGFEDERDFLEAVANASCNLDKLRTQSAIVVVLFEAKAMGAQFEYYLPHASARLPFGGDPSIPAKWEVAKLLAERWDEYTLPVHVVYFGDYDSKGLSIEKAAKADILSWIELMGDVEPSWTRGGLSEDQVERYDLPLSIEGKGYQWEALSDGQAQEIIAHSTSGLIDERAIEATEATEHAITVAFRRRFRRLFEL